MKKLFLLGIVVAACLTADAQTVIVKDTVMTTYPFGEPNPIPQVKRNCYPYCNFDEFSTTPEKQSWKMVVLENPYLRVKIFPEIGGKVKYRITERTQNSNKDWQQHSCKIRRNNKP